MTAEIAVMNKSAVALAADSAVTIETEGGQKIYNTVNKLFALSKYEPLAAMIYGSAQLLRVPWELIVKVYREERLAATFDRTEDAANDFIQWIESNVVLFPEETRHEFASALLGSYFIFAVRDPLIEAVGERVQAGEMDLPEIHEALMEKIATADSLLDVVPDGSISEADASDLVADDSPYFVEAIAGAFEELPLGEDQIEALLNLARRLVSKALMSLSMSGLVVAGYGRQDLYPSVTSFEIGGFIGDRLRYKMSTESISDQNGASIMPFAQREMVDTFISGMAPDLNDMLMGYLEGLTEELTEAAINGGTALGETEAEALRATAQDGYRNFVEGMGEYMRQNYVDPVVDAVEVLPKEELAEVAESLVNLTSFKRRVSMGEVETVGGPIDVAIISKADGLIWIKRKHYFKADLNPQFFANYYRSTVEEPGNDAD